MKGLTEKHVVFCVTSGRSGTGMLAEMMKSFPRVDANHVAAPDFVEVMRDCQTRPSLATTFWTERKLPRIRASTADVYLETSHLFCKGFFEPLLEQGVRPAIVFLHREARKVARSLLELGSVPARSQKGAAYLLEPDDPGVLECPDWSSLTDYQICYWYCLETLRRTIVYRAECEERGLPFVSGRIVDLADPATLKEWLETLGVPHTMPQVNKSIAMLSRPVNRKSARKRPCPFDDSQLGELETQVLSRVRSASATGEVVVSELEKQNRNAVDRSAY